jgi:hypothetical protein
MLSTFTFDSEWNSTPTPPSSPANHQHLPDPTPVSQTLKRRHATLLSARSGAGQLHRAGVIRGSRKLLHASDALL